MESKSLRTKKKQLFLLDGFILSVAFHMLHFITKHFLVFYQLHKVFFHLFVKHFGYISGFWKG